MAEENWIEVGKTDSIDMEDLIRFDHAGKTFCVYKIEDGLVLDDEIEGPMHQGIFNIKTGEAISPPACDDLKTYPVKVENDLVYINIS